MRTTGRGLYVRLEKINDRLGTDYWLNNNSHYGGWDLTSNKGSTVIKNRVPAREMLNYLEGLLTGIDMKEGAYK